jgi:hypothetical protein
MLNLFEMSDFRRMMLPGNPKKQLDDSAANSKSFTVPAGKTWEIFAVYVEYTSQGTAGNRQVEVQVLDGSSNICMRERAGAVQAASLTNYYEFSPSLPRETAFTASMINCPLPWMIVDEGFVLKVYDSAGIAAGDTCKVRFLYSERDKT